MPASVVEKNISNMFNSHGFCSDWSDPSPSWVMKGTAKFKSLLLTNLVAVVYTNQHAHANWDHHSS